MIEIFLQSGEYYVGDAGVRIRTLLGSCVSITLWHPVLRIGAMSHFLLSSRASAATGELDARYAEEAMSLMLQGLSREKVPLRQCQAKLFGGSCMFPLHVRRGEPNLGRKNGETARALVRAHGIAIASECLFGVEHRHIIFDISTGHVWSRRAKQEGPMSRSSKSP